MRTSRLLIVLLVVSAFLSYAAIAQEMLSGDEALTIMRETPVNVPELIEKVKRGPSH